MEKDHAPQNWTPREWLAFMLLNAASVDGKREKVEIRYLRVGLGNEVVDAMLSLLDSISAIEAEAILKESLPYFVKRQGAREKLQRILRDIFMADGEYGPEEQALTQKISGWIRAASSNER